MAGSIALRYSKLLFAKQTQHLKGNIAAGPESVAHLAAACGASHFARGDGAADDSAAGSEKNKSALAMRLPQRSGAEA